MQKTIASNSIVPSDAKCSTSVESDEKEKNSSSNESCTVYFENDALAFITTLPTESCVSSEIVVNMDTSDIDTTEDSAKSNVGADIQLASDQSLRENSKNVEHEQLQFSKTTHSAERVSDREVSRNRRQSGTSLWEPLLIPSKMDGKVEMITALKKVDSDLIRYPKTNPRKSVVSLAKESLSPTVMKTKVPQTIVHSNTSPRVLVRKECITFETKRRGKREVLTTKKKEPEVNINEQMGRAIAEKEAAILKEIEKAMKEATTSKTKSVPKELVMPPKAKTSPNSEHAKTKAVMKVVPNQNIKKKNVEEVPSTSVSNEVLLSKEASNIVGLSGSGGEIYLQDGTKLVQSLSSREVHGVSKMLTIPGTVYTTSAPTMTNEIHSLSTVFTVPGTVVTTSPSVVGSISRDTQAINKILTVPGKMMMAPSSSIAVPITKDLQPLNQMLCGTTTMIATPGPSIVTNTNKDALPMNKYIAVPVNTNTTKDVSPNPMQRIVFLATPSGTIATSGGIPLLTSIIPASSIPVTHAPINLPVLTAKGTSMEKREPKKVVPIRKKETKPADSESERCSLEKGASVSDKLTSTVRNVQTSLDIGMKNLEMPPLQNTQSSLDVKKPMKCYSKQSQSPIKSTCPKDNKLDMFVPPEKLRESQNSITLSDVRMNGKSTEKVRGILENANKTSLSDPQKVDCNGESMDVDEESILEELDQGDDLRSTIDQKMSVVVEAVENSHSRRNRNHLKEGKNPGKHSSRKTVRNQTDDVSSSEELENRLRRIEELYSEIPPAKSRISLTEDDYSKIRDGFRDSFQAVQSVTASFKSLISQSYMGGCREFVHSSCQTDATEENDFTRITTNSVADIVQPCDDTGEDKPNEPEAGLILCRLCGGFFQKKLLIAIFGKLSKKRKLLSMLTAILPQSPPIRECDGLPQQVCAACIDKLTLCHNIINQFLQADKELRQVLQEEKPVTSSSISVEEGEVGSLQENQTHFTKSESIASEKNETLRPKPFKLPDDTSACETSPKMEDSKGDQSLHVQQRGEKRTHSVLGCERLRDENTLPNHKHKRRRSKSPKKSGSACNNVCASSKSSAGCIDLSRLDPEFNDGFEVEWCLDEETIRSSMITEEVEGDPDCNENLAAADLCGSPEGGIGTENKFSAAPVIQECVQFAEDTLESSPTEGSHSKANDSLSSNMPKLVDEVSKLSEMHTSVCESTVKCDSKQTPVSAVLQENPDVEPNDLFQSKETYKCSCCPLSFPSKQEAFLHKVMQHEEELIGVLKPQEGKQNRIIALQSGGLPQKQTSPPDSKTESARCEETGMCDQCGLSFPSEYSLSVHKRVSHENVMDLQSVTDTKGSETLIVNTEESVEENKVCKEMLDALMTDGKMLVKCGRSGMLWVSCSKLFSDSTLGAAQSSDQSGVPCASVDTDTVSIVSPQKAIPNVSAQCATRVQFAYKCDHCKQMFPSRSELLNHMQSHLTGEYSCSECGAKFPTMDALNNHIPSHIPSDRVCDECGIILHDSKKLLQHRKEHTHNLPHVCESCGKRFPNEQTLEVHEPIHYNKRGPLACSLCRKCFFFKHTLVRHRSQHSSNTLQKCSLCFRVLNTSDQLRKHVALHHLMKNFVCFCKQTFPSQKELVEHRYLKHTYAEIFCARYKVDIVEPLPLHQCSICFRVLNSKQSLLKHHVTSHSSTWPFYCIQCSRKYTSMLHLARHDCHRKNTSTFQCRICGKAFQNKRIFKQHKAIHNNKKWKYICRHCGKAFVKSQSLVSHIMTHGGKKFSCPRCHLHCKDKEGLLKHYNTGSCQMKAKSF